MKYLIPVMIFLCAISTQTIAQNVGIGNTSPNSKVDVSGDLALREGTAITVAAGTNTLTLPTAKNSVYRLTGASGAFSISSISAGNDGMLLTLINATGQIMTVSNGTIQTNTGASLVAGTTVSSVTLIYNATLGKWIVISGEGFNNSSGWNLTGNAGTTSGNFVGTTDNNPLYLKTNNNLVGYLPLSGGDNLLFGYGMGSPTGGNNVTLGNSAGGTTSAGNGNVSIGSSAQRYLTTGNYNVGIGYQAGPSNNTGSYNVVLGYQSMLYNGAGSNNISIGQAALYNSSGSNNVAIGQGAGGSALGNSNVFLGNGAGGNETGSNKLYIANSNTSTPLIYGDFNNQHITVNDSLTTEYFQMTNGAGFGDVLVSDFVGHGTWVNPATILATFGHGTQNYVTKWNNAGGTTIGNSQIYDNGTNVGIATASPTSTLTVNGKTTTTNLEMTSGATAGYVLQSDASGNGTWVNPSSITTATSVSNTISGNTISTTVNSTTGTAVTVPNIYTADGTLTGNRTVTMGGNNLYFNGSGNVGIGSTSPSAKLVALSSGSAASIPSSSSTGVFRIAVSNGEGIDFGKASVGPYAAWMQVGYNGGADPLVIQPLGGNVGIGNINPGATLDVTGNTRTVNFEMTNGANNGYILQSDASGNASWVNPSSSLVVAGTGLSYSGTTLNSDWTTSGSNIYNNNTGNVGIGTTSPNDLLTVGSPLNPNLYPIMSINTGGNSPLFIGQSTSNLGLMIGYNGNDIQGRSGSNFQNNDILVLNQYGGNVGVGTTTPGSTLTVNGTTSTTNFQMTNGGTANYILQSDASGNGTWVNPSTVSASNIYNSDGTLTTSRTVTQGVANITFSSTSGNFYFNTSGNGSVAMGNNVTASGNNSFATGLNNTASGTQSFASGSSNTVSGGQAFVTGNGNNALGTYSMVSGQANTDGGSDDIVGGFENVIASGYGHSLAIGYQDSLLGSAGAVFGFLNRTYAFEAFAQGDRNIAGGQASAVFGSSNTAAGASSFVTGYNDTAYGSQGFAAGTGNTSESWSEMAVGTYGTHYTPSSTSGWSATDRVFDIGNGSSPSSRSDAFTVLKNGNVGIGTSTPSSTLQVSGKTTTTNFQMTNGGAANYILQSDASGNASWVNPNTITTATTVSNTSAANNLSTTVNGVTGSTVPIVNSISNTSSTNTLSTTVNGVTGSGVNIINSNTTTLAQVSGLVTSVNGVAATTTIPPSIITNVLGYNLTGSPVYQAITAMTHSVSNTIGGNTISTTVDGTTGIAMTIPNIYTANGTLTGARTVTMVGNTLNFTGGNVGIGATPSYTLDVSGNLRSTFSSYLATTGGAVGVGTTSPESQLANTATNIIGNDGQGVNTNSLTWAQNNTGYTGAFYNASTTTEAQGLAVKIAGTATTNRLLDLSTGAAQATAGTSVMVVQGNGQVGIGNSSPTAILDVNTATTGTFVMPAHFFASGNTASGNVTQIRIGTSASNYNATEIRLVNGTSTANNLAQIGLYGTTGITVNSSGSLGVGTTNPGATLDVAGTARVGTPGTIIKSMQVGQNTVGAQSQDYQYTLNFPNTFANIPKVIATCQTQTGQTYTDNFSIVVQSVSTSSCILRIHRTDSGSAWGQTLLVNWFAFDN